jgi:hypothetical protein
MATGVLSTFAALAASMKRGKKKQKRGISPVTPEDVSRPGEAPEGQWLSNRSAWVILGLVIAATAVLRCQYLYVPLERDEGEYAYGGQLLLQGVPPFQLLYNMKLPGTQAAYALAMALFGQTIPGIRIGLLLVNAATTLMVFCLGRRIAGPLTGIVAAAVFAILSIGTSFLGPFGHATHFVLLPALGGLILLDKGLASGRGWIFFSAGVCLGLAVLMKQPGAVFALFALGWWGRTRFSRREEWFTDRWWEGAALLAGMLLLGILTAAWMAWAGVFDRFWFWVFSYARAYSGQIPFAVGLQILSMQVASHVVQAPVPWALAGLGLIFLATDRPSRSRAPFLLAFLFFSFLGVCPGFYFRPHYFVLMIPAVGLLAGVGVEALFRRLFQSAVVGKVILFALLAMVFVQPIYAQRNFLFGQDPLTTARQIYGANPFPESIEVARYIKERSTSEDTVAVFGSEPQIFFYAQRRSATGYIYTYSLMENQPFARRMQEEMAQEVEQARPKFIVFVDVSTSWLLNQASDGWIFEWLRQFLDKKYEIVGVAEIFEREPTQYRWGAQVGARKNSVPFSLVIFQRREKN